MAFPGLVAASNLADTENKEAVWDNLGNGIDAVILATNSIRNNTMVGAVAGSPGTFPTNWRLANSAALSYEIIGTGTEDGISYIDVRFFGTNIPNREVTIYFSANDDIPVAQGQTWTASFYAKIVGGSQAGIGQSNLTQRGGTLYITGGSSPIDFSLVEARNVLFDYSSLTGPLSECRVFLTHTFISPLVNYALTRIDVNFGTTATAIDFTLRIGMPQMERGEYLTPPIATTNAPASALATVPLSIKGDDILELTGVRIASVADFVRIKGLATPAQPRLTAAAASVASGTALRDNALLKVSPSSEGDYFLSRGTLDGQSLRVNGLNIASLSGSPFSGSTASCPLLISSFAAPTNLRINNVMASGTLAFPERAIPIETDQFIFYAKAGQS
jgi:hypothetical protein